MPTNIPQAGGVDNNQSTMARAKPTSGAWSYVVDLMQTSRITKIQLSFAKERLCYRLHCREFSGWSSLENSSHGHGRQRVSAQTSTQATDRFAVD